MDQILQQILGELKGIKSDIKGLEKGQQRLEVGQQKLEVGQQKLEVGQQEIKQQIDHLIAKSIGEDGMMTVMIKEQQEIKEDMKSMKHEILKLTVEVKELDAGVAKNNEKLFRIIK